MSVGLNNIACVLALTPRSLVYLQGLRKENLMPVSCLVLSGNQENAYTRINVNIENKKYDYVDLDETIGELLDSEKIPWEIAGTADINSDTAWEHIRRIQQNYVIYSGYGGCILKRHLFETGKHKWLHVHAGKLPEYRGSTTAYYSLLQENKISATAIFMNPGIDEGDIICSETFEAVDRNVDIDYLYEPYVRSQVLIKALRQYQKENRFEELSQDMENAETYYIIHPILKHIALMELK